MSNTLSNTFLTNYTIDSNFLEGATCNLSLLISPKKESVTGNAKLFQGINPPLIIDSEIIGTFTYINTMTGSHILLVLTGYSPNRSNPVKNLELRIVLKDDWQTGSTECSYRKNGQMITVKNQKTEAINLETNSLAKLAVETKMCMNIMPCV